MNNYKSQLYKEEHALLNKLIATESDKSEEAEKYKAAVRRTIERLNQDLAEVEKDDE
ncbi:hypothetical protein [Ornithinibacillus sp. JPR2-1]|uniref:hypothetical protein n=1 Tax=Ornithinibacillus sp. JPR2-1 TaxID=2094019 RepID=UPI0031DFB42F